MIFLHNYHILLDNLKGSSKISRVRLLELDNLVDRHRYVYIIRPVGREYEIVVTESIPFFDINFSKLGNTHRLILTDAEQMLKLFKLLLYHNYDLSRNGYYAKI